jgi:hypothetical protein
MALQAMASTWTLLQGIALMASDIEKGQVTDIIPNGLQ